MFMPGQDPLAFRLIWVTEGKGFEDETEIPDACVIVRVRHSLKKLSLGGTRITYALMFTLWESLDAVRAFAGKDYQTALFYPDHDRYLIERDLVANHYEVETAVGPNQASEGVDDSKV